MKPGALGVLTGGVVGAVCRPVLLLAVSPFDFQMSGGKELSPAGVVAVVLTSALIGLCIGLIVSKIAVSFRSPGLGIGWGATVGAILAWGARFVTFFCLCMATYSPNPEAWWALREEHHGTNGPSTALEMLWGLTLVAVSGAIPAVIGGYVAHWRRTRSAGAEQGTYPPEFWS